MSPAADGVRLAELLAALSLVADLGLGQPMEHILRETVIAMRLAERAGLTDEERRATYYVSLLAWVGCAADTTDVVRLFGDETALYNSNYERDAAGLPMALFLSAHLGSGRSPLRRIAFVGSFFASGGRSLQQALHGHCLAASDMARQLGLGDDVCLPLQHSFERWDGKGTPGLVKGEDLAIAVRVVQLADAVEVLARTNGADAALALARGQQGTRFDPRLVDVLAEHAAQILSGLEDLPTWDEVIGADVGLSSPLDDDSLDSVLEAFADFADLKSPSRLGHSRGVAALAQSAGHRMGLPAGDVRLLRRAALLHDVAMMGVSSSVWNEVRPWTESQREKARTHPYLGERMLARSPALAPLAQCAALHHERLDGSGYPRGLTAESIPLTARILAAADVRHALGEDRPQRPALSADAAEKLMKDEVRQGRLDGDAVNAVLAAAGHRVRARPNLPGGLTPREAQVLVLLARGSTNPAIASALGVSRKTVSAHLEHIYTKLAVSTRTEAALLAMRQGLLPEIAKT